MLTTSRKQMVLSHPSRKYLFAVTVNPIQLETGLRPNSAGIPYTLLLRIEAMGLPIFGASTVG